MTTASESIPGQVLAEPGWCYVVLLAAVGGIALFLPPRRSSAPGNQHAAGGPASQPADAPAASASGPQPDAAAAQGRASGAAGSGGGDGQSGAGAAAGRSAAADGPATRPAAESSGPPGPLSGVASNPAADLAEGSVEPGGAGAPAEAAVAGALRRWSMADDDGSGGGGARDAGGAPGRASPPLQPAARPSGQPGGREADGAGAGRPEADRAASVPLFSGFVSYEMLEAVVVEGGRGAVRREAGAHWVKMKGPGAVRLSRTAWPRRCALGHRQAATGGAGNQGYADVAVTCLVPRDTGHLAPPPRAPAANGALFARALRAATAVAQGAHMAMCTCSRRVMGTITLAALWEFCVRLHRRQAYSGTTGMRVQGLYWAATERRSLRCRCAAR
jgi:hypothetical protein